MAAGARRMKRWLYVTDEGASDKNRGPTNGIPSNLNVRSTAVDFVKPRALPPPLPLPHSMVTMVERSIGMLARRSSVRPTSDCCTSKNTRPLTSIALTNWAYPLHRAQSPSISVTRLVGARGVDMEPGVPSSPPPPMRRRSGSWAARQ